VAIEDERARSSDSPGQRAGERQRALRRLRVRGILHDEVEPSVRGGEALDGDLGLGTEKLDAAHVLEAEPVARHAKNRRVPLDGGDATGVDQPPQEMDLGAAAQTDEERRRPRPEGNRGERVPPVLLVEPRPVPVERVHGQRVAPHDQTPLHVILDDPNLPR